MAKVVLDIEVNGVIQNSTDFQVNENDAVKYIAKLVDDGGNEINNNFGSKITVKLNDIDDEIYINPNTSSGYISAGSIQNGYIDTGRIISREIVSATYKHPITQGSMDVEYDDTEYSMQMIDDGSPSNVSIFDNYSLPYISIDNPENQDKTTFYVSLEEKAKADVSVFIDIKKDSNLIEQKEVKFSIGEQSKSFDIDTEDRDIYQDIQHYEVTITKIKNGTVESIIENGQIVAVGQNQNEFEKLVVSNKTATANIVDVNDQVTVKLVPVTDATGEEVSPGGESKIAEGDSAYYKVVASAENADGDVVVVDDGLVDITFSGVTASESDFIVGDGSSGKTLTSVAFGSVISAKAVDDYLDEDDEIFKATLSNIRPTDSSKTYEVEPEGVGVTTTILGDESTQEDDHGTGTLDTVNVQLIAVDESGNEISESKVAEGERAYYKVVALAPDGTTELTEGSVDLNFINGTATSEDYTPTNGVSQTVEFGSIIDALAVDDYLSEGDEKYKVQISNAKSTAYENVTIVKDEVETTITDGDSENDGGTNEADTVYVQLIKDDTKAEGSDLDHTIQLVDKDNNLVVVPDGKIVEVEIAYNVAGSDTATKGEDYTATETVTFNAGESTKTITNHAIDDYLNEGDEFYIAEIGTITQTANTFENLVAHADHSVKGTITDGSENEGGLGDEDTVSVQLIAVDESGAPIDESKVAEGEKAYYKAILTAPDDSVIDSTATVDISFTDGSATGGSDYKNAPQTVTLGVPFLTDALEDYINEGDEDFIVNVSNLSNSSDYENVVYSDGVTTTITNVEKEKPCPMDLNNDCTFADQGQTKNINVLANDSGKDLKITSVDGVDHGSVQVSEDGRCLTYTADNHREEETILNQDTGLLELVTMEPFLGTEEFTYTAVDAYGESQTATVKVHIIPTTDHRDVIYKGDGDDYIITRGGDDFMSGGGGDDVYFFQSGDGKDIIEDSSGFDKIAFTPDTDKDSLRFLLEDDGDLVIKYGDNSDDSITIKYQEQLGSIDQIDTKNCFLDNNDLDKIVQVLSTHRGIECDINAMNETIDDESCKIYWNPNY